MSAIDELRAAAFTTIEGEDVVHLDRAERIVTAQEQRIQMHSDAFVEVRDDLEKTQRESTKRGCLIRKQEQRIGELERTEHYHASYIAQADSTLALILGNQHDHNPAECGVVCKINAIEGLIGELETTLRAIADKRCGIYGHSVAVGCGSPELAAAALENSKPSITEFEGAFSPDAFEGLEEEIERENSEPDEDTWREALEDLTCQFAYWNEGIGGITTGGLSALETAFELLGWDDPHPLPNACCDEPGCKKQISCGTPTLSGYRNTCHNHRPTIQPPSAAADCEPPRET